MQKCSVDVGGVSWDFRHTYSLGSFQILTYDHGGSRPIGGGDGIRTHCLYIANVALYQLSYTPEGVPTLAQGVAGGRFATPLTSRFSVVEL